MTEELFVSSAKRDLGLAVHLVGRVTTYQAIVGFLDRYVEDKVEKGRPLLRRKVGER